MESGTRCKVRYRRPAGEARRAADTNAAQAWPAAATHAANSRPTTDPGRSAKMRPAAATAHHSAAADMSAASDGMRNSAATAATSTSASAASSGRRIGSARESGDHGGNSENLGV